MKTDSYLLAFCQNVRYLRKYHGLSRTAMARRIHISLRTLDSIESGVLPSKMDCQVLLHIQQEFHIPISQLFVPLNQR